ncbi:bifunctional phosphopantothenoylcysteine decarboxylase/phosphopantothenate--cysteine ligase CoaBC [Prochlorococcus sp. MIT 1307]|uniref:bifunctional phosphopantothenoylcysteine decarboxylase/phosphopantothenate--cysteine ligase CoaBC n=1 Tax=Prochlorococcus sp. MIT 1307 TaxID=3096219 RepID=UPI002A7609CF|nr:bifunctional phosphopantothenoylcysteine decarboxylase/phosphopantothenate--cysteine ligase CoaBC [Prochlorococcus sp. MIT 1307]
MMIEEISPLKGRRLLVAACGSIAAVKTPILVSNLIKAGAEVRCVVTPSASRLVSPVSLATLSRNRCYQDEDQWSSKEARPLHIALAEWAEIVVIAPLSASSLSRWSQGLADGLLASLLVACECPVIASPAMNTGMWANKAVQKNWAAIKDNPKVMALSPSSGLLACDRLGDGRMVDPEFIQLSIAHCLVNKSKDEVLKSDWRGKRLLVTSGPTIEALDPARQMTNRSSGLMGVMLAQAAKCRGAEVDLIHGPLQLPHSWLEGLKTHPVKSSIEMQTTLTKLQPSADAIAMAAAVTDLRKKGGPISKKISKEALLASISQEFEVVPDLLAEIASGRPKDQAILGFAALTGNDIELEQLGRKKMQSKGCDLLMANPIDRIGQGFEENANGGILLGPEGMVKPMLVTSKLALAHQLLDALIGLKPNFSKKN